MSCSPPLYWYFFLLWLISWSLIYKLIWIGLLYWLGFCLEQYTMRWGVKRAENVEFFNWISVHVGEWGRERIIFNTKSHNYSHFNFIIINTFPSSFHRQLNPPRYHDDDFMKMQTIYDDEIYAKMSKDQNLIFYAGRRERDSIISIGWKVKWESRPSACGKFFET